MNDNTEKLIRELAERLGTTAEHLWAVLIRQAPISAATNLFVLLVLLVVMLGCLFVLFKTLKKAAASETDEWIPLIIVVGVIGLSTTIAFFVNLSDLSQIAAGFFNPEYWAFKQIRP